MEQKMLVNQIRTMAQTSNERALLLEKAEEIQVISKEYYKYLDEVYLRLKTEAIAEASKEQNKNETRRCEYGV